MRAWANEAAAALQSSSAALVMMAELDFTGGMLRLVTANANIEDNDSPPNTWYRSGLIQVGALTDKTGGDVAGLELTLAGVDPAIIAIALGEQVRGRPMKLFMGVLNADTYVLLDMLQLFAGQMATMPVSQQDEKATIKLTIEHRGVLFSRAKPVRYADFDQQRYHTGDRGLEFIAAQSMVNDTWPAASYFRQ